MIQRTNKSFIVEEFSGPTSARTKASLLKSLGGQRVANLIQRTNESLLIEEFIGSKGSVFDGAPKRELDY